MHFLKFILLAMLIAVLPCKLFAQCHHFHSTHVHVSGHSHSSTYHYHCNHSRYHTCSRSHYSRGTRWHNTDPMKGQAEIAISAAVPYDAQLFDKTVTEASPSYSLSFLYYVSGKVSIGITAAGQNVTGNDICNCATSTPGINEHMPYNYNSSTFVVAADLRWDFYNAHGYQVYEGVSVGIAPFTETDHYANGTTSSFSGYNFAGQATILGLRFGRALGGFVELGYGYKGIVDGGISYDPDYKKHHPFKI